VARIRTVKPDFFLHEVVAGLPPLHRLLFIGLWTLADKRGVLEDRPRRIKAALFPWDDCDIDAMLWDLHEARLIQRYDSRKTDGEPIEAISIPGFGKHQRPHPKETVFDMAEPGKETASREKKRPAKPSPPAIPSSTAGKGRSLGKEVLESGKEILDPPKRPEAGVGELREGVERLWLKYRGCPWVWNELKDPQALRPAFDLAGGNVQEVLRVLEAALQRPYPLLTKLSHLAEHWNAYAATKLPEPKRSGRATDADKDWSDVPPDDVDESKPFEASL
jgi:hypothetical protein